MALLELENVHTYYGHIHALKGISLSVDQAEIVSLIAATGLESPLHLTPSAAC